MAYHEHCILAQQKLDILVAFTNSVSLVLVYVSDIQTTLPGHQCCGHFNSICMPMSLFSISVWCKSILGCDGLPMHIWVLEVAKLFHVFIFFVPTLRNCLVWPTYIHPYPQHIVATYGYSQTYHLWKVSCLSSEWVWVWYIHAAYTTSSWPAAATLCAILVT